MNFPMFTRSIRHFASSILKALLTEPQFKHKSRQEVAKKLNPDGEYSDWLKLFHEHLSPSHYLEIGVQYGRTLAFAGPQTIGIGVDPEYKIQFPLSGVQLYRQTSDEFFLRRLSGGTIPEKIDLFFIDGLHEYHQVVRDFLNCARFCHSESVVLLHDVVPPDERSASADRTTLLWPGDTFKVLPFLSRNFPGLRIAVIRAAPTGLAAISCIDFAKFSSQAEAILSGDQELLKEFDNLTVSEYRKNWLPLFPGSDSGGPTKQALSELLDPATKLADEE